MRVIAGSARGVRLVAPKGYDVRPTLDRVRESLFNILAPRIEGARFLDLYAGTGANGIEALSRGASAAMFIETNPRSIDAIQRNLAAAKLAHLAQLRQNALPRSLNDLWRENRQFDIIFADPPFADTRYQDLLDAICSSRIVADGGILVVEHASRNNLSALSCALTPLRAEQYGEITLSFFT